MKGIITFKHQSKLIHDTHLKIIDRNIREIFYLASSTHLLLNFWGNLKGEH